MHIINQMNLVRNAILQLDQEVLEKLQKYAIMIDNFRTSDVSTTLGSGLTSSGNYMPVYTASASQSPLLPRELISDIAKHLDYHELVLFSRTCRAIYKVVSTGWVSRDLAFPQSVQDDNLGWCFGKGCESNDFYMKNKNGDVRRYTVISTSDAGLARLTLSGIELTFRNLRGILEMAERARNGTLMAKHLCDYMSFRAYLFRIVIMDNKCVMVGEDRYYICGDFLIPDHFANARIDVYKNIIYLKIMDKFARIVMDSESFSVECSDMKFSGKWSELDTMADTSNTVRATLLAFISTMYDTNLAE